MASNDTADNSTCISSGSSRFRVFYEDDKVKSVAICVDKASDTSSDISLQEEYQSLEKKNAKTEKVTTTKRMYGSISLSPHSPQPDACQPPPPPRVRDRGYAWVVVLVVFTVNTIVAGYVKSFGLLYVFIVDYFPNASGAEAGLIMGLLVGCRGLMSPFMGALTVILGPRRCVVAGALCMTLGLLAATQTYSVYFMALTLGGLMGIGLGVSETPGYILVTDYFLEKRSLANGLRASGNPMGGIIFSPLVVFLYDTFALQGAFIILAGIMLHVAILGMFLRPFEEHALVIEQRYRRKMKREYGVVPHTHNMQDDLNPLTLGQKKPLELSFLITPAYLVYLVMVMFTTFALPSALLYIPVHGRYVGLTTYQNSVITAYISASDFVLRLLVGWFSDRKYLKNTHIFVGGLLLGGVGCILVAFCSRMWVLLAVSNLLSLCMATYFTLINVLLADQFGGNSMPSTWGFFRMTTGICNFFYPSLVGMVLDVTGNTMYMYLLMGAGLVMGGIIVAFQPLVARLTCGKRRPSSDD